MVIKFEIGAFELGVTLKYLDVLRIESVEL